MSAKVALRLASGKEGSPSYTDLVAPTAAFVRLTLIKEPSTGVNFSGKKVMIVIEEGRDYVFLQVRSHN